MLAKKLGMSYKDIREVVCETLLVSPDPDNWSEIPNIRDEVIWNLNICKWFKVYDVAEALCQDFEPFTEKLNLFFHENGIGWEVREGRITYRGSEIFEQSITRAVVELTETNRPRAASEIR